MKTKWLNLVLLLTNKIYQKKQLIVGQTGLGAVSTILTLIIYEIFLGLLSLPLYLSLKTASVTAFFVEKGAYAKIDFDYSLRRILTLTGVGMIDIIWAVKLSLILVLPPVYGPMPLYTIKDFRQLDLLEQDLAIVDTAIQTARVVKTIQKPELTMVKKVSGGNYIFYGKGQPNTQIVLFLSDKQTAIYTSDVDKRGDWQIDYSQSKFKLSPGNHSVVVFGYDKNLGVRSESGLEQFFKVSVSWVDNLINNVDVLANWSVVIIIFVGVFLTILTL